MFFVLIDFNNVIAPEVWTFDCSLWAPGLVLLDLLQIILDLARTKLTRVGNSFNQSVDDGVCSVLMHPSSASWTGCHVHSAVFTHNVAHRTRGYRDLPGNQETHGTLELIRDIGGWDIIYFILTSKLELVKTNMESGNQYVTSINFT